MESQNEQLKKDNKKLLNILLNGKSALWRLKRFDDEHPIVTINTLTGKKIPVPIHKSSTIMDIKKEFQKITNVPFYRQRLIFGGKQLLNHRSILHYEITNGSVIHFVLKRDEDDDTKPYSIDQRRDMVLDRFEYDELDRKYIQEKEYNAKYKKN